MGGTPPPPHSFVDGRRDQTPARVTAGVHSLLLRMASMSFWESSATAVAVQLRTQVCTQECKVSSPGSRTSSPTGSAPPKTNRSNDNLIRNDRESSSPN